VRAPAQRRPKESQPPGRRRGSAEQQRTGPPAVEAKRLRHNDDLFDRLARRVERLRALGSIGQQADCGLLITEARASASNPFRAVVMRYSIEPCILHLSPAVCIDSEILSVDLL
jgi:hypothetical protein